MILEHGKAGKYQLPAVMVQEGDPKPWLEGSRSRNAVLSTGNAGGPAHLPARGSKIKYREKSQGKRDNFKKYMKRSF